MLVLSRKKDEIVRIGDTLTIPVVEIRGDKVRLRFESPKEIFIGKEEIYQALKIQERQDGTLEKSADDFGQKKDGGLGGDYPQTKLSYSHY
ncbi:MAG: carbon storage regulator [Nanoarchaeota archaeon]